VKTTRTLMYALSLAALAGISAYATESAAPARVTPAKELKPQTVCPVMGKPIDSAQFIDIQGQRVYFCCAGCSKKLAADPDKYFKQAAAEGVLFQNIQKRCPVSGEVLIDKNIYSDHEGRRVYFCCDKCKGAFAKSPLEYLKKMDAPAKGDKPAEKHGDDAHSHH